MAVDYGSKRTGLAVTDPLQIIAGGLPTILTRDFRSFLDKYLQEENVVQIVFGKPVHMDGTPTALWKEILNQAEWIRKKFPDIEIEFTDESFTSKDATRIMVQAQVRKKHRKDKKNVDKISAVLILQNFLGHI
ncbi:MAG TPA: Holliday junction resolvase RuvX [Saprospiraceae bacterium]|nr:Holliday junction resolvase RuvX [Saprospiraceae bacterium]